MATAYYSHPDCRVHDMGAGHPECGQRLDAIADHLIATGLDALLDHREAPCATDRDLALAHESLYVDEMRGFMAQVDETGHMRALDPDTFAGPGTWSAALHAAGAAVAATDAVIDGTAENAFCAIRPPGHHATRRAAMGFCFFNNVAVAARHALDVRGLERVAIVDFDVHHGNGTEDIVANDDRILMASFFQHPLYPNSGTQPLGENMVNVPLPAYSKGSEVREVVDTLWMPRLEAFKPQMVFISAGFDAHREDDLGQLGLVEADYAWITQRLKGLAERHAKGRIVSCLEGGYALSALARSVASHLRVLAGRGGMTMEGWSLNFLPQIAAQLMPAQAASQAARLARPMTPDEFGAFARSLFSASAAVELAVLGGCLLLAWGLSRVLSGRWRGSKSVLFGERIIDGALFPTLALLLALLARFTVLAEVPVAVMRVAIAMLLALAVIRLFVRVLQAAFPKSEMVRIGERWLSWAVWIGLILWITGVLPMLAAELDAISWKLGTTRISLRALLEGAFNAVVVLMLALWVSSAIETRLLKGQGTGHIANVAVRKMAANATRALLLLVGLLFALSAAGIDLTALSVLGGAVGVGLGLGLQKLASNYVSGFVILAERSLNIGDLVKVDGFEGRITDINTRSTVIRAASGRQSIVPNEMLVTQRVENASSIDPASQDSTKVRVAHGTDVPALRPALLEAVLRIERVMKDASHAPAVHLSEFVDDGLQLTVWYWNGDPQNGQDNLRSEVNLAILSVFTERGVQIPVVTPPTTPTTR